MEQKASKETEIDWHDLKERLKRQSTLFGLHTGTDSLQEQWMRLFGFFQYSTEGMLLINEAGKVLLANRECQRIFGRNQSELLESDVFDLLPLEKPVEKVPKTWLKAAVDKGLYTVGKSVRDRKSFSIREVGMEVEGEEKLMQVYVREVTELVRQTEYEAEQTAMFLQMLSHAREPMILLDASLTIFEFNEAAARMMHGITNRFMKKGESYLDFATPGRAKEKGWEIFREVLSGLIVERNIELPSPMGGNPIHWLLTYQPLYDVYGEMAGVLISGLDQTRERAWQAQVREQADRLSAWESRTDTALMLVDANAKVRYAGGAWPKWLNDPLIRLEGSSIRKLLPQKSQAFSDFQAWMAAPTGPYDAIWEIQTRQKTAVRIQVHAAIQPLQTDQTEDDVRFLLQCTLRAAQDRLEAQEEALTALRNLNLHQPVRWFFLFDVDGTFINQADWPPPGRPDTEQIPANLVQVLGALGKQAKPILQKWEHNGGAPVTFHTPFDEQGLEWQYWEPAHASGLKRPLLALTDTSLRRRLPFLEKEVLRLQTQLEKLHAELGRWRLAFDLISPVFHHLSWEYDALHERLKLNTNGKMLFFDQEGQWMPLRELHKYFHPADGKQFLEDLGSDRLFGIDGWIRVRNAQDDFEQWHYRIMPAEGKSVAKGLFYRPLDNAATLSLGYFLGFSRFLDDIGWGALVLDQQMRLEHASTLAQEWLQLSDDWLLQRFDNLQGIAQTRLAAEACSLREPGSLFQFEYYNAYTGRWMFVWIYTTQSMRAVYLQQMKK